MAADDFDDGLAEHMREVVHNEMVEVDFRQLAGDAAQALGQLAETIQGEMIVVGSRKHGSVLASWTISVAP